LFPPFFDCGERFVCQSLAAALSDSALFYCEHWRARSIHNEGMKTNTIITEVHDASDFVTKMKQGESWRIVPSAQPGRARLQPCRKCAVLIDAPRGATATDVSWLVVAAPDRPFAKIGRKGSGNVQDCD